MLQRLRVRNILWTVGYDGTQNRQFQSEFTILPSTPPARSARRITHRTELSRAIRNKRRSDRGGPPDVRWPRKSRVLCEILKRSDCLRYRIAFFRGPSDNCGAVFMRPASGLLTRDHTLAQSRQKVYPSSKSYAKVTLLERACSTRNRPNNGHAGNGYEIVSGSEFILWMDEATKKKRKSGQICPECRASDKLFPTYEFESRSRVSLKKLRGHNFLSIIESGDKGLRLSERDLLSL
jgi:hypothetical protein